MRNVVKGCVTRAFAPQVCQLLPRLRGGSGMRGSDRFGGLAREPQGSASGACPWVAGADGQPLRVVPHQLRHTYATTLVNAGMSLQALMALLGHVTAEMTLRYATLASPTLGAAYDEAIGKARPRLTLIVNDRPVLPSKAEWLRGEMLKPDGPRLLQPPPRRRSLPLRQHLRTLR